MFRWQLAEYLGLPNLLAKAGRANAKPYAGREEKVIYGTHARQYALVCLPPPTVPLRDVAVFFVHGGGWESGTPSLFRFIGRFLAQRGFPTIMAGYRLTPYYRFPAQLEDTCASFRAGMTWLAQQRVPVKRLLLGGQSAGAQLVSLLAYNQAIVIPERTLFSGLVAISGPLDFAACRNRTVRRLLRAYIGHLSNSDIASPLTYARSDIPISALCLHGAKDPLVDIENSKRFVDKLNQGAIQRAKLHVLPDGHHSDLANLFLENSADTQYMTNWLEEVGQA